MTAMCVCVLSALGAGASWSRAEALRTESSWLLERSRAQASEYALSFNDTLATQQLESFAQRRALLERAYLWQRLQTLAILLTAGAAVGAWVLSLLGRLQGDLEDARADAEAPEPPEPFQPRIQRSRG